MVIKMTDSSNKKTTSSNQQNQSQLRRTKMRPSQNYSLQNGTNKNTKAEFKRLKTILPSIKRKENVSKLDIILEAIKYIDDLQDQLFDRLSGTHSQREATLLCCDSFFPTTRPNGFGWSSSLYLSLQIFKRSGGQLLLQRTK